MKLYACCWDMYEKAMNEAKIRVAIDAGANDGGYTLTLARHGFKVHAFEPVPRMFAKMKELHKDNPDVICNNLGLSDVNAIIPNVTVLDCWTIGNPGMGGLQVSPDFRSEPSFDMKVVRLDDYLDGLPIGIIKLDVDGYEFKVLRGAEKTIRKFKPPILCEFGTYLSKIGDSPKEFVNYIFNLGYNVVPMDGNCVFDSWDLIEPQFPFHTTFDVMLIPK